MNDRPDEHSGSRWEPAPQPPAGASPAEGAEHEAPGSEHEPRGASYDVPPVEHEAAAAGSGSRRFSWRGRGPLVALATGIVALSGVGGYALGNAATTSTDEVGLVGNQVPGNGQLPGNGAGPGYGDGDGSGQVPGVPPWADGHGGGDDRGDRDGDGWKGDGDDWGDRDGDGERHGPGHHGWAPGTPPDGGQLPYAPDGSGSGTTSDESSRGRET